MKNIADVASVAEIIPKKPVPVAAPDASDLELF